MSEEIKVQKIDMNEIKALNAEKEFNDLMEKIKRDYELASMADKYVNDNNREK